MNEVGIELLGQLKTTTRQGLVMTTIFTSKIEGLPPTSAMKMIDIWLSSSELQLSVWDLTAAVHTLDCSSEDGSLSTSSSLKPSKHSHNLLSRFSEQKPQLEVDPYQAQGQKHNLSLSSWKVSTKDQAAEKEERGQPLKKNAWAQQNPLIRRIIQTRLSRQLGTPIQHFSTKFIFLLNE